MDHHGKGAVVFEAGGVFPFDVAELLVEAVDDVAEPVEFRFLIYAVAAPRHSLAETMIKATF